MRLLDLDPRWATANGSAIYCDCPCGRGDHGGIVVPLANPRDGGPPDPPDRWGEGITARWQASSYDFATLSLTPSIVLWDDKEKGIQHWHGFITDGEVRPC